MAQDPEFKQPKSINLCQKIKTKISQHEPSPEKWPPMVQSIQDADCNLWEEFTQSNEFEELFPKNKAVLSQEDKKASDTSSSTTENKATQPDSSSPTMSDDAMGKALLTISLIGLAVSAKTQFLDKKSKKAFFMLLVASASGYFSYQLSNNQASDTDRDLIPVVIFLSGIISIMGAKEAFTEGYKMLTENIKNKKKIPPETTKSLLEKIKFYTSLDDSVFHRLSKKAEIQGVSIEPKTIKKLAGVAALGTAGMMGYLAIQKFCKAIKSMDKQLNLASDSDLNGLEEDFQNWLNQR